MFEITSQSNQKIKKIKSLKEKKYRDIHQMYLVEGYRIVEDAIKSKMDIVTVVISSNFIKSDKENELLDSLEEVCNDILIVPDYIFEAISNTKNPQGICICIKIKKYTLDELLGGGVIILDNISDPGNLGTIIRTSEAANFSGIIISKKSTDPYSPKATRATMGSIFRMPIVIDDISSSIEYLKENEYSIYASTLDKSNDIYSVNFNKKAAFVIGNEAIGIRNDVIDNCTGRIKIPMPGEAESLNAASAASIIIYEYLRQNI